MSEQNADYRCLICGLPIRRYTDETQDPRALYCPEPERLAWWPKAPNDSSGAPS